MAVGRRVLKFPLNVEMSRTSFGSKHNENSSCDKDLAANLEKFNASSRAKLK